ncbi:class I SAM-dependent methyltransferase [Neobacillus terrae]|uniref:class I SAM-dependent methyltransferase n=1 Tax=Neobacillus terrae TaxID=3034837 RepID=UPI00140DC80A|nr:class I SAM-dependent methyltransferase [Neobacillus terrae]NHM33904.1 class I SAM-dependent methyltransferase [Neobacillus terrae]
MSTYLDFVSKFGIGGAHPGGIPLTKEILNKEQISSHSSILDAGCGTGQTAAFLYINYGVNVTGLEINHDMVAKALERMASNQLPISIIQGSIENIPLSDNTFDFVLSESVLAFVNKPKALKEFNRVLNSGGRLIANEMTINQKLKPEEEEEVKQFYGIDSLLTEEEWIVLLKEAGFKEIVIYQADQSIFEENPMTEFNFSQNAGIELFQVMNQHANIILKYQGILSHRIIKCTK